MTTSQCLDGCDIDLTYHSAVVHRVGLLKYITGKVIDRDVFTITVWMPLAVYNELQVKS